MDTQVDRLLTVPEARVCIPVGVTTMQNYINSGALRSLKIGGRRFVPESAIQEFILAADALQQSK